MLKKKNNLFVSRFAPSPSGFPHIGNMRTAIISYLYAKENDGKFILRIEDTDTTRTSDIYLKAIYKYLDWLSIFPDEGPLQGGLNAPYIQSQRGDIYLNYLNKFIEKGYAYRCFKTVEELDEIREKQKALNLPPRYERECSNINIDLENKYLKEGKSFIWRFKLPSGTTFIEDKVKGKILYDLSNFADSPITRQDGTFTFLFANFVDDVEMGITCVIRGEEHTSNTAIQSAMYDVLEIEKPLFYHLPLIVDSNGKKLSKRDFGFSLQDLINENYLPEAIINYLLLIGSAFKDEIFSISEAISNKLFTEMKSYGSICYDTKKLDWINKQWIKRLSVDDFIERIKDKSLEIYGPIILDLLENKKLINDIKNESESLNQSIEFLGYFLNDFCLKNKNEIKKNINNSDFAINFINEFSSNNHENLYLFTKNFIKNYALKNNIEEKMIWKILRKILINKEEGLSISVIYSNLKTDEIINRLKENII